MRQCANSWPARLVSAIRRALGEAERGARRELEEELRRSQAEYQELLNSIDRIAWQAELPGLRMTSVSEGAERLLGYPLSRWLGEARFWQEHVHPEDREKAVAVYTQLTPAQRYRELEYRMLAADGRVVWIRDIVHVRAATRGPPQIHGIMLDITERRRAEEKVSRIRAKLEKSCKELVRQNKEIQNFYHTLSHELKTPLTSAREFIAIVMDGLAGPLNQTQTEYLGIARESCDQLRVCINDLLDATRLETGKLALELKTGALGALVHRAVTTMLPLVAEKKIVLTHEVQPDLPEVPLDEHRLTQVMTNLLDNALKYTPVGGQITVRAGEMPGNPQWLQVSVSDTGCGISKEEQEHIFDRLYQVKHGDAATGKGVGLGLYLCRELVQLHGGEIRVQSDPGHGSTFSFVIPKSQQALHCNLLLVEDDPEMAGMMSSLLKAENYNVRTARNGHEALELMRQQAPDIILLDLAMPEMDGAATLTEIRRSWGAIPIIVQTGRADSPLMKQALAFSPFTVLAKPYSPDQLLEAVRKVLRSGDTALWKKNHPNVPKLHMN